MGSADAAPTTGKPVERFKATSGRVTGVAGLVLVACALAYVAWQVHTLTGLRFALAMVVVGVVVWITQLRPRATAYEETLVLHNMLRDIHIPLRLIEEAVVRQTLNVWIGNEKYVGVGIGRSVRALTGHKMPSVRAFGLGKMNDMAQRADVPHPEHTAMPYAKFVEIRIDDLANYARKAPVTDPDAVVQRTWARPELILLVASSVGFALSLFL